MASTIVTKNSSTASAVPVSGDLTQGELAVNVTDKRLFTKNSGGTVVELGTNPAALALPNGTANGVAYLNGSKVVTTGSALTFDGTNLGIGTSSPGSKLQVQGLIRTSSSAAGLQIDRRDTSASAYTLYSSAGNLQFYNGTSDTMTLDSSGNLGLGVTPSAWGSTFRTLQFTGAASIGGTTDPSLQISQNAYYNGTNWIYSTTAAASNYNQAAGVHAWRVAASGTAGNAITFTQAMTLDASGNLGLGTTSPISIGSGYTSLTINGSNSGRLDILYNGTAYGAFIADSNGAKLFAQGASTALLLGTNNTERARIDSSGNLQVGTTAQGSYTARVTLSYDSGTTKWSVGPWSSAAGSFVVAANASQGVYLPSTTSTSWSSASDERLKENLIPIDNGLEKVCSLRAVTGNFISDETKQRKSFLIAQDVEKVLPEAISATPDGQYLGVSYTDTIPLLVAAIQEQQTIIETLTARITALEGK